VASPVGVNVQIVQSGTNGYLAASADQWLDALQALRSDEDAALRMGRNGRALVEAKYSMQAIAPRLEAILRAPRGVR
jgi:glycosyltransferase involved in cell wall biosynthesis